MNNCLYYHRLRGGAIGIDSSVTTVVSDKNSLKIEKTPKVRYN